MKLYSRLENLEQELQKRLHANSVDIGLIVETTKTLIELGYNPNEVYTRLLERAKERANHDKPE